MTHGHLSFEVHVVFDRVSDDFVLQIISQPTQQWSYIQHLWIQYQHCTFLGDFHTSFVTISDTFGVSAIEGTGLEEAFDWLITSIRSKRQPSAEQPTERQHEQKTAAAVNERSQSETTSRLSVISRWIKAFLQRAWTGILIQNHMHFKFDKSTVFMIWERTLQTISSKWLLSEMCESCTHASAD